MQMIAEAIFDMLVCFQLGVIIFFKGSPYELIEGYTMLSLN
jgi:hypothetical protein